ncbi:MAG: putative PAS/PAC sensor protein [Rhodospirillaceae bacterium]|nr:MAG: putative PAS/PAC sensor protein [Rhodospirillaceae bacterium]
MNGFMRVVSDSQPTHIMCSTVNGVITFANQPLADHYGIALADISQKPMAGVLGPVRARSFGEIHRRVLETGQNETHLFHFEESDSVRVVTTDHVYMPADTRQPATVLTVFHDITELSRERDRSEARLNQLVAALVGVVDRRDPYSANHSARVSEVAQVIATEMGLDDKSVRTVGLSGRLMNIGKIVIPPELLTKTGQLAEEERRLLARSFVTSAELLTNVEFDGPVVETIRQIGESVDGSGPLGLQGETILITARIVAVANSFVGMVSPRAWRGAMEFATVIKMLSGQTDSKLDRRPLSALANIIDNRDGTQRWAHFRDNPAATR